MLKKYLEVLEDRNFLKRMNPLMELYAHSRNSEKTYQELLALEPLIRTKGRGQCSI